MPKDNIQVDCYVVMGFWEIFPSAISFQNEEHRLLPMDGSHNTRELGGYKTTDGKSVKWGMLFRSDKLSDISEDIRNLYTKGKRGFLQFSRWVLFWYNFNNVFRLS